MSEGERFYYRGQPYTFRCYRWDGSAIAYCATFPHQVYRFSVAQLQEVTSYE